MDSRALILGDRDSRPREQQRVVECPVCGFLTNAPRLMAHHVKACAAPRERIR